MSGGSFEMSKEFKNNLLIFFVVSTVILFGALIYVLVSNPTTTKLNSTPVPEGDVLIVPVATQQKTIAVAGIPNNLGIIIKAEQLLAFEGKLK